MSLPPIGAIQTSALLSSARRRKSPEVSQNASVVLPSLSLARFGHEPQQPPFPPGNDKPPGAPPFPDRSNLGQGLSFVERMTALFSIKNLTAGFKNAIGVYKGIMNNSYEDSTGRKPSKIWETVMAVVDLGLIVLSHGLVIILDSVLPQWMCASEAHAAFYEGVYRSAAQSKQPPPEEPPSQNPSA